MKFLPMGDATLIEVDNVHAVYQAIRRKYPDLEVVPAAKTVTVFGTIDPDLDIRDEELTGNPVTIPIRYNGPDLPFVAEHLGLTIDEFITQHQQTQFKAAFAGFAPGFMYLEGSPSIPRRDTPRTSVPAGSVALADTYCGIYPQQSPGGWQIIGETPIKMWDLTRPSPAYLSPGDTVTFEEFKGIEILSTGYATIQDSGRRCRELGVTGSGFFDRTSAHRANRMVGNDASAPLIEIVMGLKFRVDEPTLFATTGPPATILTDKTLSTNQTFIASGEVEILPPEKGMRIYLAASGGITPLTDPILGSYSVSPGIGAPLEPGSVLRTGNSLPSPSVPGLPVWEYGDAVLRVKAGPREWARLTGTFTVSSQSDRIGVRLEGSVPRRPGELPSEAMVPGAIQVPPDGSPIIFGPDHPVTGGYPVVGVLDAESFDRCGQLRPGDKVRFVYD